MGYASYFLEKSKKNVNKLLVVGPNSSFKPWEHEYFEMTGEEPMPELPAQGGLMTRPGIGV